MENRSKHNRKNVKSAEKEREHRYDAAPSRIKQSSVTPSQRSTSDPIGRINDTPDRTKENSPALELVISDDEIGYTPKNYDTTGQNRSSDRIDTSILGFGSYEQDEDESDDEDEISVDMNENADDTERTDCSPIVPVEAGLDQTTISPRQQHQQGAASVESFDDNDSNASSSSSSDDGSEVGSVDEEKDGDCEVTTPKTPKPKTGIIDMGKKKLRSLSQKRSKSKESKRKSKKKDGSGVGDDSMDSSWRASFSRERKRGLHSIAKNIPSTATSPTQQVNTKDPNTQNSKDSSLFRYIRSWGRDKAVVDTSSIEDSEPPVALPIPPSLGVSRTNSGPLPSSSTDLGKRSVMASPLSISMRQRSSSTTNVRSWYTNPPSSPTNYASPQPPSSPVDKQKSLKSQLLFQIQHQLLSSKAGLPSLGDASPKVVGSAVADISSDDNDSMPEIGHDEEYVNFDDTNEDSSLDSYDVSDDDDYEDLIEETINWSTMPALPNRFCQEATLREHQPSSVPFGSTPVVGTSTLTSGSFCPETNAISTANLTQYGPPNYLDASVLTTKVTRQQANPFVWEQRLLLQAVLQLLAERDQVGVEGSMDSSDNIWKKGPLRKLSFTQLIVRRKTNHKRPVAGGVWKVRYVELRHGNLCYYEDSGTDTKRKTIHLRQADTIVRDSIHAENKRGQQSPGYCFEVAVQGSPTTIWMASSEEERQAWVRAIKSAMIGEDATTNNTPRKTLDLTPYQESLQVYTKLRESLQLAKNREMYLAAIHAAMKEVASLQVPVEWVREQIEHELSPLLLGTLKPPKFTRSPQKALKSSITEFWRNMRETTFSINGLTIPRNSYLASERVIGALTRAILEFDKAFVDANKSKEDDPTKCYMSELQAVSYTRNILLATLRSKERHDAVCAAKYLLENPGLVSLDKCPNQDSVNRDIAEVVYIEISFAGTDLSDDFLPDAEEMSGWVLTRTRRRNTNIAVSSIAIKPRYIKTFAVLSGALLSFYEASSPRPHGLKGQLTILNGSTVRDEGTEQIAETSSNKGEMDNISNVRFILSVSTPGHQDRMLAFENQSDLVAWKEVIQAAIDSAGSMKNPPRIVTTTTTRPTLPGKMILAKGAERAIMVAEAGTKQGIRAIKGATDMGIRAIKTSTDGGIKVIRGAVGMLLPAKGDQEETGKLRRRFLKRMPKRPSMHILLNNTIVHGRREPSVQCVVQTMQAFYVRDPNSTEHATDHSSENETSNRSLAKRDGLMTIQAKIYQAFLMSGGPSGRIGRGVALVEIDFVETNVDDDEDEEEVNDDDDLTGGDDIEYIKLEVSTDSK